MPDNTSADDNQTLPHQAAVPRQSEETRQPARVTVSDEATLRVSQAPVAPTPAPAPYYNRGYAPPPPPPAPARGSAARDRMRRRRVKPRGRGGEWAWVVISLAMLSVVIVISMSLTLLLRASQDEPEVLPTAVAALPTPVDGRLDFSGFTGNLSDGQQITLDDGRSIVLQPWDGESRFTVLLMGLDRRPGETGLAYRTDTMMLVSLDPDNNTIGILSIPRDLYVEVPGYGQLQRVNTPMVLGELQQPGYGPRLAMQTVQYNLGIRVHDYIAVDFNAVIKLIDLIGGVDMDIPYNISDPQYPNMYYGYEPFYIRAGFQHLDGATALKYARTRHGSSDFQRAERQQQVIFAVRDKILDMDMLPQLIVQAPSLWANFSQNVYTGLSVDQMIQLAWYVKDMPQDNIRTGVLGSQYVMNYMTSDGAAVLIPNRSQLGPLMVQVFGANYSE